MVYLHNHIAKPVIKSLISSLLSFAIDLQKYHGNTEMIQPQKFSLAKLSMLKVAVHVSAAILLLGITMCIRTRRRLAMVKS